MASEMINDLYRKGYNHYYGKEGATKDLALAIKYWTQAAEHGHHVSQYYVAWAYEFGQGVEKNEEQALFWYRKSADNGNRDAKRAIGNFYYYGKGGLSKDNAEAVKWYRISAEEGNLYAQFDLGWAYEYGQGIEKDLLMAIQWYRKSADQGYAAAQYKVGQAYYYGSFGVTKDRKTAIQWYQKAAEQGNRSAQYALGLCYAEGTEVKQDMAQATHYFYLAAMQGDIEGALYNLMAHYQDDEIPIKDLARCRECFLKYSHIPWIQTGLGDIYLWGKGVEKNYAEALQWYHKAAQQDSGLAYYRIGCCYEQGLGVDKNLAEARNYFQKAADKKIQQAIAKLSNLNTDEIDISDLPSDMSNIDLCRRADDYFYGRLSCKQDYKEAVRYYYKAAQNNYTIAQVDLGNCYFHGHGVPQDYFKAAVWYRKAADRGYIYGLYNLAWAYEHGKGVPQNLLEAQKLYKLAAQQGHPQAKAKLQK